MFRSWTKAARLLVLAPLLLAMGLARAQSPQGTLTQIKVFGPSLDGNLEGDDPNRDVFVYLPPSYASHSGRRYPVLYFLHGYSVGADTYVNSLNLPKVADELMAGGLKEMIIVLPDANSVYSGSMYSNSPTTGDWEGYVSGDLVAYVDSHYRTIPERASRGLAGHSMGGYGTVRIGMKHAEVFGAIYAMSACCLMNQAPNQQAVEAQIARMAGGAPAAGPAGGRGGRGGRGGAGGFANVLLAQAAAWAPDPMNPPLYIDWPYMDGELDPIVQARWLANSPLVFVDQYVPALESFAAIAIDVGDKDTLMATNRQLSEALDRLGVEHGFEIYDGDHTNRVGQRFREDVLPFFAKNLK